MGRIIWGKLDGVKCNVVISTISASSGVREAPDDIALFQLKQNHKSSYMIEVIILAIALSMDAFAVSIGLGAKQNTRGLALKAGLFFGIFQALMPLIGYVGGTSVLGWIEAYAHSIAFGLLALIGAKMIYEGFQEGVEEEISAITNKMMLILSIATSIDAMAAGFSLTLLDANPYIACLIIGTVTFAFSWVGVYIGKSSGTWLESKAEIFGGLILILMGFKILIF